jgi:hypothetical protein
MVEEEDAATCTARVSRPERDDVGHHTVELRQQHRTKQTTQALLFVAQLACFQLDMASPVHRQAEQPEERTGNLVKSGDRPLHSVDKKIESALTCAHRPLRVGEAPKRRGQNTVFEATGELHPGFEAALRDPDCTIVPTVKVDGTCACIIGGRLYKRRDVRGGKRPPPGAVPGGRNCGGDLDLCWLVTEQSDPGDKYFLAAGAGAEGQFWCFSREGDRVVAKLDDGSYELIGKATSAHFFRLDDRICCDAGPNVQGNPYQIPVEKNESKVTRHFLLRHGQFSMPDTFDINQLLTKGGLDYVRDAIVAQSIEGIVFHLEGGQHEQTMFKINRGHLNRPAEGPMKFHLGGTL